MKKKGIYMLLTIIVMIIFASISIETTIDKIYTNKEMMVENKEQKVKAQIQCDQTRY